jgi:diadenosine tetraphosphate (Ap4A) HIT family hydrolase
VITKKAPVPNEETKRACHVCEMRDRASAEDRLYADENWTAITTGGVPGWVMLLLNRHSDEWSWGLNESEAIQYGVVLQKVSEAIRVAVPAERIYLLGFGENALHFHHLLLSRTPDTPIEWRKSALQGHGRDLADPLASQKAAEMMRVAIAANDTEAGVEAK